MKLGPLGNTTTVFWWFSWSAWSTFRTLHNFPSTCITFCFLLLFKIYHLKARPSFYLVPGGGTLELWACFQFQSKKPTSCCDHTRECVDTVSYNPAVRKDSPWGTRIKDLRGKKWTQWNIVRRSLDQVLSSLSPAPFGHRAKTSKRHFTKFWKFWN